MKGSLFGMLKKKQAALTATIGRINPMSVRPFYRLSSVSDRQPDTETNQTK